MKKALKLLILTISIILSILICSCDNSVGLILDAYNSKFTPIYSESETVLSPGDDGFSGSDMLLDKYVVSQIATLNLTAPNNCGKYEWVIQDPENGSLEPVKLKTMQGTSINSKQFALYIPESGLKPAKTYRLCLKVLSNDIRAYEDYATLAIYNDYYFDTGVVTIPPSSNPHGRSAEVISNDSSYFSKIDARSILPNTKDIDDSQIHYYLYAKNLITGDTIKPFEIDIEKDLSDVNNKTGNTSFNLPKGSYFLTLMGLYGTPAKTDYEYLIEQCALIGFASVDNRYNDSAKFILKSSYNTQVGWAKLNVFTTDWDFKDPMYDGYDVVTELLDKDGNSVTPTIWTDLTRENITANQAPVNSNYKITMIAGTYRFNVIFYKGLDKYEFSDLITISTGLTTEANFGIPMLIPIGYSDFKLFTDNWDFSDAQYAGYNISTTITKAIDGRPASYTLLTNLSRATLTASLPSSANYKMYAELGSYILNVSFTKGLNTYTWSCPFNIEAGKVITITDGIPSSVIPNGIAGGG